MTGMGRLRVPSARRRQSGSHPRAVSVSRRTAIRPGDAATFDGDLELTKLSSQPVGVEEALGCDTSTRELVFMPTVPRAMEKEEANDVG
jgi:hypothetical protein